MNKLKDNIILSIVLTTLSAAIYFMQYWIFHRTEETFFYLFQDMAFVPVQALIVTLVINKFLNIIESRKKIKKLNVIISLFFTEAGINIMRAMSSFNRNHNKLCEIINIEEIIENKENVAKKKAGEFEYYFYADPTKLEELEYIMRQNEEFLRSLLINPNLHEHESFTDMLWAVFHVADEIKSRGDLRKLSKDEIEHLSTDLLRAYRAMVVEWTSYIIYLKTEYPFLYTAAIKKNPFCPMDKTEGM